MDTALAALLVLGVAAFVGWPFFAREAPEASAEAQLTPLERQKLEAYAAIKEAEFDYQMGKLTEPDFTALRDRYTGQAIAAIAAIESAHGRAGARRTVADRKAVRIAYCPNCGRGVPPRANFCPGCGRALKPLDEAVA
jgi:hypothetical protein